MNRPFKILILSCTGGAGHLRAAEALHRTAPLSGLPITTENIDVLDLTTRAFKRLYSESYLQMVNRAPEMWGYLYAISERKPWEKKGLIRLFDAINYRNYLAALDRIKPDAIICTHWLPYLSVAEHLPARGITAPIFVCTTDFDIHQLWVHPIVRKFFVFHEETAWQLASKGVSPERIAVSGIPVNPEFTVREPARRVRKRLGISQSATTLLVLSGGFGMGRVTEIAESVVRAAAGNPKKRFTLLIVCGKNEKARAAIDAIPAPANAAIHTFGFVRNIHELMDASDLLISKSGGLTSSEALAKGLPMLIVDPIPGQEARNADLIVEHGAGWKAVNAANLEYKLRKILDAPEQLKHAAAAANALGRPAAAHDILSTIAHFLQRLTT